MDNDDVLSETTDWPETEVVVNVVNYGKEQYDYGYQNGTLNGLVIAMELLLDVGQVGPAKRATFARLIKAKAQELNIYDQNSPFERKIESEIKFWDRQDPKKRYERRVRKESVSSD